MVESLHSSNEDDVHHSLFNFNLAAPGEKSWDEKWAKYDFGCEPALMDHLCHIWVQLLYFFIYFVAKFSDMTSLDEHHSPESSFLHYVLKDCKWFFLKIRNVSIFWILNQIVVFYSVVQKGAKDNSYNEVHALCVLNLLVS